MKNILVILFLITILPLYSNIDDNIYKLFQKSQRLQNMVQLYKDKSYYQNIIIGNQDQIIKIDSLIIRQYNLKNKLYQQQILNYKQIIKMDSIYINSLEQKLSIQQNIFKTKQAYYIYGILSTLVSAIIINLVK